MKLLCLTKIDFASILTKTCLFITVIISLQSNILVAQDWSEVIKTAASARASDDYFGRSVSISGYYAIVGANGEDEDVNEENTKSGAGSAYIYKLSNGRCVQIKKLVASDRNNGDCFGNSVSISGNYAIVGAYAEDEDVNGANTLSYSGSAYIFYKNEGGTDNWGEVKKLVASDRTDWDFFGLSVSISGDHVIVGAIYEDEDADENNRIQDSGSAYIFSKNEGGTDNWGEVKKLVASDREMDDYFGKAVSISGDYAVVGVENEDDGVAGNNRIQNSGSAYIFSKNEGGTDNWGEVKKLVASDRSGSDYFGSSVSISDDYLIVGARSKNNGEGAAYIFNKNHGGTDNWGEVKKIVASDKDGSDSFGYSVSISGEHAIVGASAEDEDENGSNTLSEAGSAYIFMKNEGGDDNWGEVKKITASDRAADDNFSTSVSISGRNTIVGAQKEDEDRNGNNTLSEAGSAYIFNYGSPPVSDDKTITTDEDVSYRFTVSDFFYADTDEDPFTCMIIESLETAGELKYDGNDVIVGTDCSDLTKLVFTPGSYEYGVPYATFTFKVRDSSLRQSASDYTMTIDVNEVVNDPFVTVNTGASVDEGEVFTFSDACLKTQDEDGPSYSLIYNVIEAPVYGTLTKNGALMKTDGTELSSFTQNDIANGKIKYTHNGGESNQDSFKFTVTDNSGGKSEEDEFIITINGTNDPPTVGTLTAITMQEDEEYTLNLTTWFDSIEDPDNPDSTLNISASCSNENIALSEIDKYNYKISTSENFFGNTTLDVTVSDGELECSTTVDLKVKPVNDLPVFTGLSITYTIQNGEIGILTLNDLAEDVETPDSLLVWDYSATPDSLHVFYDQIDHAVVFGAKGSFDGAVEMTVTVTDEDGGSASETITITVTPDPTGIEGLNGLPTEYTLFQNYPNPFNPSTVIRYGIPVVDANFASTTNVTLRIYDILGNELATLVNGQQSPGFYERTWNAGSVSSGIYFYVLRAGSYVQSKKMILLK